MRLLYHKIKHWEYWPTWLVYTPVFFSYLYFAARAKDMFYLGVSNPGFRNGGFTNISKKEIYDLIPQQFYPKTILIQPEAPIEDNPDVSNFKFPFIVKPDKGLRGIMVKKIHDKDELKKYHQSVNFPYLIQEFVNYEKEIGVFYVRNPKDKNGKITGIVEKEFLTVKGDGISTIEQLVRLDKRYELQLEALKNNPQVDLDKVLPSGEKEILVPFGNHNRGTLFLDASHKNTTKITGTIDAICKQIKGFNYGRIDLKFNSWADLEEGRNLSIIEVNGALSEPAHIYDPKHSFFWGISEIISHYKIMFEISVENKKRGHSNIGILKGIKEIREHFKEVARLKQSSFV